MSAKDDVHRGQDSLTSRIDAPREWRSKLTRLTSAVILFELVSGFVIYLSAFGVLPQLTILVHTVLGILMLIPMVWYVFSHWAKRRKGKLSHIQLLGYASGILLLISLISGVVITWQGLFATRLSRGWDTVHLVTGITVGVVTLAHLLPLIVRRVNNVDAMARLRSARRLYYATTMGIALVLTGMFCVGVGSWRVESDAFI